MEPERANERKRDSSPAGYSRSKIFGVCRGEREGTLCIGISPGKKDEHWERDLAADLDHLRGEFDALVCLQEWSELTALGMGEYPALAQKRGYLFLHFQIKDRSIPKMSEARALIPLLARLLEEGRRVLVHCRSGLGRSGLVCACLLTFYGFRPRDAIELVRRQRPGAIQTGEQEHFVARYGERSRSR